jgi:endonuclease YncB( thermonuclease family)
VPPAGQRGSAATCRYRVTASRTGGDCWKCDLRTCAQGAQGADRYGGTLARCAGEQVGDLGDSMVRTGLAVTFMGWRYLVAEREAQTHKRGLWRGSFEKPQDWRRRRELLAPSR